MTPIFSSLASLFFSEPKPKTTLEKLQDSLNEIGQSIIPKLDELLGGKDPEASQFAHKVTLGLAVFSMTLDKSDTFNRYVVQQGLLLLALMTSVRTLAAVTTSQQRTDVLKSTAIAFVAGYATSIASDYGISS